MHDPSTVPPPTAAAGSSSSSSSSSPSGASCPIDHTTTPTAADDVSPLNMMPVLGQTPLSASQRASLSTSREVSSIKRTLSSDEDPTIPASSPKWIYPSAQQFYNALVKKGFETDEDDVDSMVFVHNVLNEVAWKQVLEWEAKRKGIAVEDETEAELMRFKGRPGTLSPKARYYLFMGNIFPDSYKFRPLPSPPPHFLALLFSPRALLPWAGWKADILPPPPPRSARAATAHPALLPTQHRASV